MNQLDEVLIHLIYCSYAEYMCVPEIEFLVKIPDNMSLSVAAMLPSGALWALNTVNFLSQCKIQIPLIIKIFPILETRSRRPRLLFSASIKKKDPMVSCNLQLFKTNGAVQF